MSFQLREGQGDLWKNDRKNADNQPDMTGKFMLNGKLYRVAGWHKTTGSGKGFYSLAVKESDEAAQVDPSGDESDPF
jgi:hypothetical protein